MKKSVAGSSLVPRQHLLDIAGQRSEGAEQVDLKHQRVQLVLYEVHLKPGWLLASFQYVFRPSGGVPNPNDPAVLSRIGDAAVFGITTTVRY
jgi:porin